MKFSPRDTDRPAEPDHAYHQALIGFLIPYFSTGRSQRVHSVQYAILIKVAVYGRYHSYQRQHPRGAEYVAEHLAEKLEEAGFTTKRCTVRCWKIYLPRGSGWL